jgi:hypothetical protein
MNIFKKVIISGLTFLGTLAGVDVYLQLAEIQTPMETRIDPQLGPTYIPNKLITRFNEGFFMGSANEFGYMGPAVPPRRRGAERRVLLLGDSFVLGHTVLPRHYFGRYLEDDLGRATGEEVHALNFGKADFNFGNMYQYYQDFAGKFDHDLALFFVGESDLVPTGQVVSNLYPTVSLQSDSIVIDKSFRSSKTYRFYKAVEPVFTRSAVLRLVFNTYKIINSGSWIVVILDKFAPSYSASSEELAPSIPKEPGELPELSQAILRELAKDSRNVLVIQTKLAPKLLTEVKASGLPLIDLGAYLESLRAEGKDPYYWPVTRMQGHWNHAAQPLIGKFLTEQIIAGKLF